jgi:hypothetical protein
MVTEFFAIRKIEIMVLLPYLASEMCSDIGICLKEGKLVTFKKLLTGTYGKYSCSSYDMRKEKSEEL